MDELKKHSPADSSHPWRGRAAWFVIIGLALLAFWPALNSGFAGDDWGFLALSRHLDWPWALYYYDHSSSYFYRPHTMLLWWLSVAALGLHPTAHMALNLGLHTINALLLAQIIVRTTRHERLGMAIGALFALHPAAVGTALWLSDRFDLLATAAVLWAVLGMEGALAGTAKRRWVVAAAVLAAGAKETAVVLPLIAAARLLLARERSWRWRSATLAGVSMPFALMLLVRATLLQGVSTTLDIHDAPDAALRGIRNWIAGAPDALIAARVANSTDIVLAGLLAGCVGWWLLRSSRRTVGTSALAILGVTCMLAPALVQWPVTQAVLGTPQPFVNPVNLRFYYLSLSGLLMLTAAAVATLEDRRILAVLTVAALAASIVWLPASRVRAANWAAETSGPEYRVALAAGRLAAHLQVEPGCRLHLLGTMELSHGFFRFADAAVKAQSPRGTPLLECIVMAEHSPWFSITRQMPCEDAVWQPLTPRSKSGQVYTAHPVGNLCYHYFADPAPRTTSVEPASRWFQFDGDNFREITNTAKEVRQPG